MILYIDLAGIIGVLQGPMDNVYTTSSTSAASISSAGTVTGGNEFGDILRIIERMFL